MTNEEKQQKLDALESAIFEGVLRIEYSDKKIEYRSLNEMIRVRDMLKSSLGQSVPKRVYSTFGKGL